MTEPTFRCPECKGTRVHSTTHQTLWKPCQCAGCGFVGSENQFAVDLFHYWAHYSETEYQVPDGEE